VGLIWLRHGLAAIALIHACVVWASGAEPAPCRVLDAQLQGSYQGGCNAQGLAQGKGVAVGGIARYEGAFVAGAKHGEGTKTWLTTGDVYTGQFASDYRHGKGTYTWGPASQGSGAKRQRYSGEFDRDQRHGEGVFEWPNGDRYAGPWRADAQIGPLTPMQRIRRQYDDQLAQRIARPGAVLCALPAAQQQGQAASAAVVGYEAGELVLRKPGDPPEPLRTFRSPVRLWALCP
jgi:hypothetical protein